MKQNFVEKRKSLIWPKQYQCIDLDYQLMNACLTTLMGGGGVEEWSFRQLVVMH